MPSSSSSSGPFYGTIPICLCCCDCYSGSGGDQGLTAKPVRAFDGTPVVTVEGVSGHGLNIPFGIGMAWGQNVIGGGGNGAGWVLHDLAGLNLADAPDEIRYEPGPNQIEVFLSTGTDTWQGAYYVRSTLTRDSGTGIYTMTMPDGIQRTFDSSGNLTGIRSPGGEHLDVAYVGGEIDTVSGTGILYDFAWSGGRITGITQSIEGTAVRRSEFAFWSGAPVNLQSVTNLESRDNGATWLPCDITFFTWHGTDNEGLLKHVLRDHAYQRMLSAGLDPATATEGQLDAFANEKFTWDSNSRVESEATNGGQYLWQFVYETNGYTDSDPNVWSNKTTITRPDGSVETIFFNQAGSVLLRQVEKDGQRWWPVCQQFDDQMRVIKVISASAISAIDPNPSAPEDLVSLHTDQGLIRFMEYDATAGMVWREWAQKGGSAVEMILLREKTYEARTAGSTIYLPLTDSVSLDGTDTLLSTTAFSYEWDHGGFQFSKRTTTLPAVDQEQHGTGVANTTKEHFDAAGFLTAQVDQMGMRTAYTYDPATGGMTQKIVDTDRTDPAHTGLKLTTDYELDEEGRTLIEKGPRHTIDLAGEETHIRRAVWHYYRDPEEERISFPGYIVVVQSGGEWVEQSSHCVGPVTIERGLVVPALPDGTSYSDTVVAPWELVRLPLEDDVYPQTTWSRWQRRHVNQGGQSVADLLYHLIPATGEGAQDTNYALTGYAHDSAGRVDRVTTPGGTIQQTIFNVMGWPLSQLVGTAAGNMVPTVQNEYDNNADEGDGLLTETTVLVDGTTGNNRVITFTYDWRQRRETDSAVVTVSTGSATLITENTYDNRSLVTAVREYQSATGSPANLLSETLTFFDTLARPYQVRRYKVDPGQSSSPTDFLEDNTWYDPVGRVAVQWPAGSQAFQAMIYDDVGRVTTACTAYEPGWSSSSSSGSNAPDIGESIVMEQRDMAYDAAGNVTSTKLRQRYDDATDNGPLEDQITQPKARVSCVASSPDALGRTVATANYGVAGVTWDRPTLIPVCTDIVLVSTTAFNPVGEPHLTTDPMGAQTHRTWDAAGRLTEEIQGRVPGRDMPAQDRITRYTYNPDGNLTILTAVNNGGEQQHTEWVYGVTTASGSALCSNLLVSHKIYPDSQGGSDQVAYTYNRAGQVTTMTDQAGLVHTYSFDKLGRQTADEVTAWGASTVDRTIKKLTTGYDVRGLVVHAKSFGTATDPVNSVTFAHNGWRQLTVETQSVGATSRSVQYGYASGAANTIRRQTLTYPSGSSPTAGPALAYTYSGTHADALSRPSMLQGVESSAVTTLIQYTWLGLGTPVDVLYPMGGQCHCSLGDSGDNYAGLDRFGRPVEIIWIKSGTNLVHANYGYDRSSNRQWRRDAAAHAASVETEDQWYEYDGLYQVRGFQRGDLVGTYPNFSGINPVSQNEGWNYDAMGNWLGYTNDALNQTRQFNKVNEITGISGPSGAVTPQYDPAGNMTVMPKVDEWETGQSLSWDAWNRLVKVSEGSVPIVEYTYDALFRRITKTVSGTTRRFYYNNQWQILEEYVGSATDPQVRYWYGIRDINDIARRQFFGATNTDLYALRETMNVVALVNTSGTVQQRMAYDAFGNARFMEPDWDPSSNTAAWPLLFHAHYQDSETGLYQMRFRYYHPLLGAWLSRDFLDEWGGLNLFRANLNDFVNMIDTLGLAPEIKKRACAWAIYMGHGEDEGYEKSHIHRYWDKLQARFPQGLPEGNKIGFNGCHRKYQHEMAERMFPGRVIPSANRDCNCIQRMYDDPSKLKPDQWPEDGYTTLKKLWDDSIKDAEAECKKKGNCCASITINILCVGADVIKHINQRAAGADPKCGSSKTIKCEPASDSPSPAKCKLTSCKPALKTPA